MKNCKRITIHKTANKIWVEYEQKTTTDRIYCLDWSDAEAIAHALDHEVENWIETDEKEEA